MNGKPSPIISSQDLTNSAPSQSEIWDAAASGWALKWNSREGAHFRRRAQIAVELALRHMSAGHLLDYGTGDGYLLTLCKEHDFVLYGCDVSKEMVKISAGRPEFQHMTNPPILATCENNSQPFATTFDLIFVMGVFPYFEDYWEFASGLRQHLNPNGVIIANCTNRVSLYNFRSILGNIFSFRLSNWKAWLGTFVALGKTGIWSGGAYRLGKGRRLRQCYSAASFDNMFLECGFLKIEQCDMYGFTSIDSQPLHRSKIGAFLARQLAWNHIGVYQVKTPTVEN
jgi:2-polyprenyl-3-methyl-5-hydroxy-6-metoxy-1,4-benzoquinol methylase